MTSTLDSVRSVLVQSLDLQQDPEELTTDTALFGALPELDSLGVAGPRDCARGTVRHHHRGRRVRCRTVRDGGFPHRVRRSQAELVGTSMFRPGALRGFLATVGSAETPAGLHPDSRAMSADGSFAVWHWGLAKAFGDRPTFTISRVVRDTDGRVPHQRVAHLMRSDPGALTRLLPPFGAVSALDDRVTMVADSMGFQPLFHTPILAPNPVMSSSCLLAARTVGAALDPAAVGSQSLLGWQLGQRTLFAGVDKLAPGAVAQLNREGVQVTSSEEPAREALSARERRGPGRRPSAHVPGSPAR